MNCKQGDLAVIVRSVAGNEGAVVTCLELVGRPAWYMKELPGPIWRVDRILRGKLFNTDKVADIQLRPLRDSDGEDEILRIAGRPLSTLEKA
jgi:hypothetical protein